MKQIDDIRYVIEEFSDQGRKPDAMLPSVYITDAMVLSLSFNDCEFQTFNDFGKYVSWRMLFQNANYDSV